ncbi:MAG: sigma 54-interacting transcriptional regulator [Deltaproteobacteria bacterium]|nr:sigma 54-interacting transcriptional regulator [Deltaproteobacteria bacterium]
MVKIPNDMVVNQHWSSDIAPLTDDGANLKLGSAGRQGELTALRDLYETHGKNHGTVVLVLGPKGVGKSLVLEEFRRQSKLEGIGVFATQCHRFQRPSRPLEALLEQAASYIDEFNPSLVSREARFAANRILAAMAPGKAADENQDRHAALIAILSEHLAKVASIRPPIVLVSNLHHTSSDTIALIEELAHRLAPADGLTADPIHDKAFPGMLLLSWRSDSIEDRPFWTGNLAAHALEIRPLPANGVADLLRRDDVAHRVARLTGGRPRLIEALLTWGTPDADGLVRQRFQRLSNQAREVAVCCAATNRPIGVRRLTELSGVSAGQIGIAIEELLSSGLMTHTVLEGEIQIDFRSSEDRTALASTVMPELLRSWHFRIGEYLNAEGNVPAAARHLIQAWDESHDLDELLSLVLEAVELLDAAGDVHEAAELCHRTEAIVVGAGRRTQRTTEFTKTLAQRAAMLDERRGDYQAGLDVLERELKLEDLPSFSRHAGRLCRLLGRTADARRHLDEALRVLPSDAIRERAEVLIDLAEVALTEGRHENAAHFLDKAEDLDEDNAGLADLLLVRGKLHASRGDLSSAAHMFEHAIEDARQRGRSESEIRSLVNLGIIKLRGGDQEAAATLYAEALEMAERTGDRRHQAFCQQNLAVLAHWRRDYRKALFWYHESVRNFQRLANQGLMAWVTVDLGDLYLELGDTEQSKAMTSQARFLLSRAANSTALFFLDFLDARLKAEDGLLMQSKRDLVKVRQLARKQSRPEDETTVGIELARIEARMGNQTDAMDILAQLPKTESPKLKGRLLLTMAEQKLPRTPKEALDILGQALDQFEESLDPDGQWKTMARMSEAHAALGDQPASTHWRRQAREVEASIRATVPPSMMKQYPSVSCRNPYLSLLEDKRSSFLSAPKRTTQSSDRFVPTNIKKNRNDSAPAITNMIGAHPVFQQTLKALERIAASETTVLLTGESGTGKELAAEAIHDLSTRHDMPLVKVNCAALVETLLLSELFGHERGAFTGALRTKKGRFEVADGGTIFLDEIGDISPRTQVALLRVLQERTFERVGGTQSINVNVRIVCATNRNLDAMVQAGTFREDLYYRLKGIQVELPPLRARGQDVLILAKHILDHLARTDGVQPKHLTEEAGNLLMTHGWPGNVRELENVLRSAWVFADGSEITASLVSQFLSSGRSVQTPTERSPKLENVLAGHSHPELPTSALSNEDGADANAPATAHPTDIFGSTYRHLLDEGLSLKAMKKIIERECIVRALDASQGNITQAAKVLGMKRPRLSQLVKEHGLSVNSTAFESKGESHASRN